MQTAFKTDTTTQILCSTLEVTLESIRKIYKAWEVILRDISDADDGITLERWLQWFIEACLALLEDQAKLKWNNQAEAQRVASYYTSMQAFLKQLLITVVPAQAITRPPVLVEGLTTAIARNTMDSLEHLVAKVEHQVQLAQTLGTLLQKSEQSLLDEAEMSFWRHVLAPAAKDALAQALHLDPKATPNQFQVADGFAQPFDCYPVQDLRRAILARSKRYSDWRDDIA